MEILRGIDARPASPAPTVVTIGKFVVVHRGHAALLARVTEEARRSGARPGVVTFDRDPMETIDPARAHCMLATLNQRLESLERHSVDVALVLEFTPEVAALEPEEFAERTLAHALGARKVIVGEDFRFGHHHRGDIDLLRKLGAENGFEVDVLSFVRKDGEKVSSSQIRKLVLEGRVDEAGVLLGSPWRLHGTVVEGAGRGGSLLGFPTANLRTDPRSCLPAFGVYAGWWVSEGHRLPGAINVGMTPTFSDVTSPKVEIHILDFEGDLYGSQGEIEFVRRLREERKFDSTDALVEQMRRDVAETRQSLSGPGP